MIRSQSGAIGTSPSMKCDAMRPSCSQPPSAARDGLGDAHAAALQAMRQLLDPRRLVSVVDLLEEER